MSIAKVYKVLATIDGGQELIEYLQGEMSGLRDEAAKHRANKNKVLEALGVKDGDSDNVLTDVKRVMDTLKASNNDPNQMVSKLSELGQQVADLTAKYQAAEKTTQAERQKRIEAAKLNSAIEALTKSNATNPTEMAALIMSKLDVGTDDSVSYRLPDGSAVDVTAGVKGWLDANPWAVRNAQHPGAGGSGNGNNLLSLTIDDIKKMSTDQINKNWEQVSKVLQK